MPAVRQAVQDQVRLISREQSLQNPATSSFFPQDCPQKAHAGALGGAQVRVRNVRQAVQVGRSEPGAPEHSHRLEAVRLYGMWPTVRVQLPAEAAPGEVSSAVGLVVVLMRKL